MNNISDFITEKLNSSGYLLKGDPNIFYMTIGEYKEHTSYMRRRYGKLCSMIDPIIRGEDNSAWISFSHSFVNGWKVYDIMNDISDMKSKMNKIDKIYYNDLETYFN